MQPDSSFEELYKTHYRALRAAAANIISDSDAAHDIVQEVFLKFWHRKDDLSKVMNQRAYLFKSVVNASLTYLSKNKSNVRLLDVKMEAHGNPGTDLLSKELNHKIRIALNSLPPKCKAVFVLSRFEQLKNKEIAKVLGISIKTVENQMGIALKKMRVELTSYFPKDIMHGIVFLLLSSFFTG